MLGLCLAMKKEVHLSNFSTQVWVSPGVDLIDNLLKCENEYTKYNIVLIPSHKSFAVLDSSVILSVPKIAML